MKLYTDDLTKTAKEFNSLFETKEKEERNTTTVTKLSILSLVYGSTLSTDDILELGDILHTIADYRADKEKRL